MNLVFKYIIFAASILLASCEPSVSANKTTLSNQAAQSEYADFELTVFGAIHGGHRSSERYALPILEKAIREFNPDVIFIEIPPSSMAQAQSSFDQFGEVRERRTRAFPELTDTIFPLRAELGFELVPTAAWSRQLANDRAAVLKRLENDPSRKAQWDEHIAARRNMGRIQRGKNDDPLYIHSAQYDAEVKTAQTPYEIYFDKDIGAGGWGPINDAHIGLMTDALDRLKSEKTADTPMRILVVFGAWHKYKILEAMEQREDVNLIDARQFFQ